MEEPSPIANFRVLTHRGETSACLPSGLEDSREAHTPPNPSQSHIRQDKLQIGRLPLQDLLLTSPLV